MRQGSKTPETLANQSQSERHARGIRLDSCEKYSAEVKIRDVQLQSGMPLIGPKRYNAYSEGKCPAMAAFVNS
jgi:hypothetical protein